MQRYCMRTQTKKRLETGKDGENACGGAGEHDGNVSIRKTAVQHLQIRKSMCSISAWEYGELDTQTKKRSFDDSEYNGDNDVERQQAAKCLKISERCPKDLLGSRVRSVSSARNAFVSSPIF